MLLGKGNREVVWPICFIQGAEASRRSTSAFSQLLSSIYYPDSEMNELKVSYGNKILQMFKLETIFLFHTGSPTHKNPPDSHPRTNGIKKFDNKVASDSHSKDSIDSMRQFDIKSLHGALLPRSF